ncbi:MAG TPA: hypothetical protein VGK34_06695 [Armatimonadota bacterium]
MYNRDVEDALIEYLDFGIHLPNRKNHRLPADTYAGEDCIFFFTICASKKTAPFVDPNLADAVIESLLWRRKQTKWALYCLMPDHLHVVLKLEESITSAVNAGCRGVVPRSVLDQIGDFKKYTTTQLWWKQGHTGHLWQSNSYDRVVQLDENPESVVKYVLNNPVRKGLAEHWTEYPFCAVVDHI